MYVLDVPLTTPSNISMSIVQASLCTGELLHPRFQNAKDHSWIDNIETATRSRHVPPRSNFINALLRDDAACNGTYSCKDCRTARICRPSIDGGFIELKVIPCTGLTPFCEPTSGSCVAQEPETCGAKDDFVCMGNGRYPDADCLK